MKKSIILAILVLCAACGQPATPPPTPTPPAPAAPVAAPPTPAVQPVPATPPPPPPPPKPVQAISASSPIPLPEWLPQDVPLCNEAMIRMANRGPQNKSMLLEYAVASDADAVVAFYRELSTQEKWSLAEEAGSPLVKKFRLTKDTRTVALTITPGTGETVCSLEVTQ